MVDTESEKDKIIIERSPADNPYAKIVSRNKLVGRKDWWKQSSYISDDRRSGVADRRKGPN
jgi:hypothetical protein